MIREITRDELLKMRTGGAIFTLVDVLPRESFNQEHLPGAISIPLAEIDKVAIHRLRKEDTIVVYCGSFECGASAQAGEKLAQMGFANVLVYKGGLKDYKGSGLPLEGSLHEAPSCASCCACGD